MLEKFLGVLKTILLHKIAQIREAQTQNLVDKKYILGYLDALSFIVDAIEQAKKEVGC